MTIKTANRLAELRKSRGLSQEELADKLGVTRQAVSKWERAESAPDTDNLIELAKIYGVTLDELVHGETQKNDVNEESTAEERPSGDTDKDENADEDEKGGNDNYSNVLYPAFAIIATIAYLLLGFIIPGGKGWACYWFLFILIPVVGSIGTVIKTKKASHFNYPCLVTATFCAVGMFAGMWHPMWVIFVTIPVFYIIVNAFEKSDKKKE